jgi:hypothetical protein
MKVLRHLLGITKLDKEKNQCVREKTGHVAAIQERVTAVLRSIPKEAFADSFQKLYERCQKCVVKDGDYFEGQ